MTLKLDLGAGGVSPEGFIPLGHAHGSEIFPLPYADNSADVIRASHCLEHFPHRQVDDVVREWVRVLKPGGVLRIAVPDFKAIAEKYLAGEAIPTEAYVMGGQIAPDDHHAALFDRDRLRHALAGAGLTLLRPWQSELEDGAALPISLNIEGTKPFMPEIRVSGAMSVPRLGFMDNFFCAMEAMIPCNVKMRKHGGAFWGQSMTKVMERILEEDDPDAILTLDYDSVFLPRHLAHVMQLMMCHPEADAIAPIQSSRHLSTALFTYYGTDGENAPKVPLAEFAGDLTRVPTAHFGLTLIRAKALRRLPKPWFHSVPSPAGDWNDGHVDEDIAFWRKWEQAGNTLFLANRVAIGHAELMVRWPGEDLQVFFQSMTEFNASGVPEGVWQ